jgi:hypothetical protein
MYIDLASSNIPTISREDRAADRKTSGSSRKSPPRRTACTPGQRMMVRARSRVFCHLTGNPERRLMTVAVTNSPRRVTIRSGSADEARLVKSLSPAWLLRAMIFADGRTGAKRPVVGMEKKRVERPLSYRLPWLRPRSRGM